MAVPSAHAVEPQARAADRDCADFANQRDAQNYFLRLGGPGRDPDRLDGGRGDGIACESLPCPCSRAQSRPRPRPRPRPKPKPKRKRAQTIKARITDVVDGDTIKVQNVGESAYDGASGNDVALLTADGEQAGSTQVFGARAR